MSKALSRTDCHVGHPLFLTGRTAPSRAHPHRALGTRVPTWLLFTPRHQLASAVAAAAGTSEPVLEIAAVTNISSANVESNNSTSSYDSPGSRDKSSSTGGRVSYSKTGSGRVYGQGPILSGGRGQGDGGRGLQRVRTVQQDFGDKTSLPPDVALATSAKPNAPMTRRPTDPRVADELRAMRQQMARLTTLMEQQQQREVVLLQQIDDLRRIVHIHFGEPPVAAVPSGGTAVADAAVPAVPAHGTKAVEVSEPASDASCTAGEVVVLYEEDLQRALQQLMTAELTGRATRATGGFSPATAAGSVGSSGDSSSCSSSGNLVDAGSLSEDAVCGEGSKGDDTTPVLGLPSMEPSIGVKLQLLQPELLALLEQELSQSGRGGVDDTSSSTHAKAATGQPTTAIAVKHDVLKPSTTAAVTKATDKVCTSTESSRITVAASSELLETSSGALTYGSLGNGPHTHGSHAVIASCDGGLHADSCAEVILTDAQRGTDGDAGPTETVLDDCTVAVPHVVSTEDVWHVPLTSLVRKGDDESLPLDEAVGSTGAASESTASGTDPDADGFIAIARTVATGSTAVANSSEGEDGKGVGCAGTDVGADGTSTGDVTHGNSSPLIGTTSACGTAELAALLTQIREVAATTASLARTVSESGIIVPPELLDLLEASSALPQHYNSLHATSSSTAATSTAVPATAYKTVTTSPSTSSIPTANGSATTVLPAASTPVTNRRGPVTSTVASSRRTVRTRRTTPSAPSYPSPPSSSSAPSPSSVAPAVSAVPSREELQRLLQVPSRMREGLPRVSWDKPQLLTPNSGNSSSGSSNSSQQGQGHVQGGGVLLAPPARPVRAAQPSISGHSGR